MNREMTESNFFNALKGLAIICVLIAHTAVPNTRVSPFDRAILPAFGSFGLIGVPCFFLISGYFYFLNQDRFLILLWKKLKSIGIPWMFCGSLVYFISSFFGENSNLINVRSYFMFILGNGSLYYYLPLLILYFILFYFLKARIEKWFLPIVTANMVSLLALDSIINPYLNPLNFILFFALGLVLKKYNSFLKITVLKNQWCPILVGFILILTYLSYFEPSASGFAYFKTSSLIYELLAILLISAILVQKQDCPKFLIHLGKLSFSVYLLHLPVAGAVNFVFSRYSIPFIPLKSLCVLVSCYLTLAFLKTVFERLRLNLPKLMLGMR